MEWSHSFVVKSSLKVLLQHCFLHMKSNVCVSRTFCIHQKFLHKYKIGVLWNEIWTTLSAVSILLTFLLWIRNKHLSNKTKQIWVQACIKYFPFILHYFHYINICVMINQMTFKTSHLLELSPLGLQICVQSHVHCQKVLPTKFIICSGTNNLMYNSNFQQIFSRLWCYEHHPLL
jgi:hypothetical protein